MKHLRHLVHIVSARFFTLPSSQKENVTPILHSSFKKSPSVGRVTARYSPCFLPYSLTNINEKATIAYFSKKYPQKFW